MYKTHPNFSRAYKEKIIVKHNLNIKRDEINIMNISDNTFNLRNSLLNNNNRYLIGLVCFVEFYGLSTFVGYLTPNPFLCK